MHKADLELSRSALFFAPKIDVRIVIMEIKYTIGIDEAGRGPVAGPISVGAVCARISSNIDHELFSKGIKDSKKLTPKKRDILFAWIQENNDLKEGIGFVSASEIDSKGIVSATAAAMQAAIDVVMPEDCAVNEILVLLDGGLRAPEVFKNQQTIIKGDEKEVLIALASIMAKVSRDREMKKIGEQYPKYGFGEHKGYGTKAHYEAIQEYGICSVHRKSFLTRVV